MRNDTLFKSSTPIFHLIIIESPNENGNHKREQMNIFDVE